MLERKEEERSDLCMSAFYHGGDMLLKKIKWWFLKWRMTLLKR